MKSDRALMVSTIAVAALMLLSGCNSAISDTVGSEAYTVSGIVVDDQGNPIEGATIVYKGNTSGTYVTAADGKWTITGLVGPIEIEPQKSGWSFEEPSMLVSSEQSGITFTGRFNQWTVGAMEVIQDDVNRKEVGFDITYNIDASVIIDLRLYYPDGSEAFSLEGRACQGLETREYWFVVDIPSGSLDIPIGDYRLEIDSYADTAAYSAGEISNRWSNVYSYSGSEASQFVPSESPALTVTETVLERSYVYRKDLRVKIEIHGTGSLYLDALCYYPDGNLANDFTGSVTDSQIRKCNYTFAIDIPDGMVDIPSGTYKIQFVLYRSQQDYQDGVSFETVEHEYHYL